MKTDAEESREMADNESRDTRRVRHTEAEQRRRNAIKHGYDYLWSVLPNNNNSNNNNTCSSPLTQTSSSSDLSGESSYSPVIAQRITKVVILKKATDHLCQLSTEHEKLKHELEELNKELACYKAQEKAYRDIMFSQLTPTTAGTGQPGHLASVSGPGGGGTEEKKLALFHHFADRLFVSFLDTVKNLATYDLQALTTSIFEWVEVYCNPTAMEDAIDPVKRQLTMDMENLNERP